MDANSVSTNGAMEFFKSKKSDYFSKSGLTIEEWKEATKFKAIDFGWVIMCVGMSLGAGIVFLPM